MNYGLVTIPKAEDPTFPIPAFLVIGVLPGASPKDVERLVVDPIEIEIKALEDIKSIKSEIGDGLAVLQVEFHAGVDPERKRDEVQREITALRPRLPSELVRLDVTQFNSANVNIVELALVAESATFRELDLQARALKRRVESVKGVRDVHLDGLPGQEVNVVLDLPRLIALGIPPTEVLNAINADSANIPAGSVESGTRQFSVKTSGEFASVDEVRDTLVRSVGASAVRVRDVTNVHLADADPAQLTRFEGRRAVLVSASQQDNNDLFTVRRAIQDEVKRLIKRIFAAKANSSGAP